MNNAFLSYLSEPINAKLIVEIYKRKQITTTQLLEKFNEIPQATLYRRMQKMLKDGVLKITGENHIRGTVEKMYALNFDFEEIKRDLAEANDSEMYLQYATIYMLGILREFQEYTAKKDIDIAGDGSGLSIAPIYATTEELREALIKIGDILLPLVNNPPGEGRQLRNLCIINTPPKN